MLAGAVRTGWLIVALWSGVAVAQAPEPHLLRGAAHFRAARYDEALVEFRVAEKLGAGADARWYVAATLSRLDRPLDALEAFVAAAAEAPESRDALLTYEEAVASHQARLYARADRLLAQLGASAGPKVAEQAARLRAQMQPLLARAPAPAAVDFYLERAAELSRQGRRSLAALFATEALAVARRSAGCHRCGEAETLAGELGAAAPAGGATR